MKIDSPTRFTSFYESFSDLIFGVMAILVLLVIIFLSLLKPEVSKAELEGAMEEIQQLENALRQSETEKEAARDQLEELTKTMVEAQNSVHSKGLELIITIDVSGSMDDALSHLIETIRTMTVVLPAISPEFRLGIIAYAKDSAELIPNGLQIFRVRQIFAEHKDGGKSLKAINQFMSKLSRGVMAPVDKAIHEGIKMSSVPGRFDGYQAFMVIGDVGPYETGDGYRIESDERIIEADVINAMKDWVSQDENRSILSFYSAATPGNGASEKAKSSYEFFRKLAAEPGQPENFSQNSGKMLGYLLNAIIKNDE